MGYRCEDCNKNFSTEESYRQHNFAKHTNEKSKKINFKKYFIFLGVTLTIILLVFSANSYMKRPGQYNDFAKCLTEKGAVVYGNDYCSYTIKQLNFFGKSKEFLNYMQCASNQELCDSKAVSITPTWEINGKTYSGVQTFEMLSGVTGCEI